jgi:hypothetical protein
MDHETIFPLFGSDSTQQLDSVIFMRSKIYAPRFQIPPGEDFDQRSWKKSRLPHPSLVGRPSATDTNVMRLDSHYNKHWPAKSSSAVLVQLTDSEEAQCTSVPSAMSGCVWYCVSLSITQK